MLKAVIVNDCAYVMLDMLPYLQDDFNVQMITRTRSIMSKTIGIFSHVLFAKGDLFHVSYALQDAYIVQHLKHLDVLHVHGSDVRTTMKKKKYSWMVKSNLRKAKTVLYSTPDLKDIVLPIREDAIYFHTPVDVTRFHPKKHDQTKNPSAVYFTKPYEKPNTDIIYLLSLFDIELDIIKSKIPYELMPTFLRRYEIFIDQTTISARSKMCLEAMSCGLATVDYKDLSTLEKKIDSLLDCKKRIMLGIRNSEYVFEHHNAMDRAYELLNIWREII